MDRDLKKEEQQRMQKELFEAISATLGGKKFFCNIVVHQGDTRPRRAWCITTPSAS